jgi:hypothetical protein
MRCALLLLAACGDFAKIAPGDAGPDACVALQCQVTSCASLGMPPTTVSGTVYAPNGTLPLYGVTVYVPNAPVGTLPAGATCNKCGDPVPGSPVTLTKTDETGHFSLQDVPVGANIPLVITTGKWRRQLMIPNVAQCTDTPLAASDTRLPKSKAEGDLPMIAVSTGPADALECTVRKLGIADSEFTTDTQGGNVHMYAELSVASATGTDRFATGFGGGTGMFSDSTTLWSSVTKLQMYDLVILSCEGAQHPETKPQPAMDAMKAYADGGGRVFASHWHNIWIEGSTQGGGTQAPAVWPTIATWSNAGASFSTPPDTIDEVNNPLGPSFARWMLNVMGSTTRDAIQLSANSGRTSCMAVDNTKGVRWVYWDNAGMQSTQDFTFTTPMEMPADQRCGRVAFSDMHASTDSTSTAGMGFPSLCSNQPLSAQEKAIAFIIFELASCASQ